MPVCWSVSVGLLVWSSGGFTLATGPTSPDTVNLASLPTGNQVTLPIVFCQRSIERATADAIDLIRPSDGEDPAINLFRVFLGWSVCPARVAQSVVRQTLNLNVRGSSPRLGGYGELFFPTAKGDNDNFIIVFPLPPAISFCKSKQ